MADPEWVQGVRRNPGLCPEIFNFNLNSVLTYLEVECDGIYGDDLLPGKVLQGTSQEGLWEEEPRYPVDLKQDGCKNMSFVTLQKR